MKSSPLLLAVGMLLFISCQSVDKEQIKKTIYQTEKDFEKMAAEKGIAEAFHYFADENATIKRRNDTLITGKDNIKSYYVKQIQDSTTVNWTPDFIDVSADGTMAYTYGKFVWKFKDGEFRGVFHTVWKKQQDGSWKYVWD